MRRSSWSERAKRELVGGGLLLAGLMLGGCPTPALPPAAPARVHFAAFVSDLMDQTSADAAPVSLDGLRFEFPRELDAFDAILARGDEIRAAGAAQ